ncbi:MAG TPA: hypothetical protein VE710_12385 [Candidatus Bathyarchaeia archaeon]|nr:hypothetical protein [Candidatus Bathyarchaeia archaeon]
MNLVSILIIFSSTIVITILWLQLGLPDDTGSMIALWLVLASISIALQLGYTLYLLYRSTNTTRVEKFVRRHKKHPYYAYVLAYIEGNLQEQKRHLERMKSSGKYGQVKALGLTSIYLEEGNVPAAKNEAAHIKIPDAAAYTQALIALHEKDWDSFHHWQQKVTSKPLSIVLQAEEAFATGNMPEADRLAEEAIRHAYGLQRLLLIRARELKQKQTEHRKTYF